MKNYLKLIFTSVLFITIVTGAIAQEYNTISGTITGVENGETLLGVNVYFKNTNYGTITNEYGFYSLSAPKGNYTMVISYLGYGEITQSVLLEKNTKLNIKLEVVSEALEEVSIITNSNKSVNTRSPQMSVNKLSAAAIKKIPMVLGEVDPLKAITILPGVTKSGEAAPGFSVRGGGADQNLVLLDEATIYSTDHLFGFLSVFNNDAIKNLQLYKGGTPAKYGGRISSVLDIRQKDGNSQAFQASGGVGLLSSRLTLEGPIKKDKTTFLVAGRTAYVNLFLKAAGNVNRVGFYDLNAKFSHKINDNNRLYLSGYFGRDEFGISKSFKTSFGNASVNLRWNHIFSDKLFSNLSLIYSDYDFNLNIVSEGLDWETGINNYNVKYDFKHYTSDKIKLNFGANTYFYAFNPGDITIKNEGKILENTKLDKKNAIESALYVEAEHKITDKLNARYGLRYSYFLRQGPQTLNTYQDDLPVVYNSDFGIYESATPIGEKIYKKGDKIASFGNFEPRLSLSYQLNENSSVKASYQRMSQYIHLISNTNAPTPTDVWAPSDNFIKPQLGNQYALGYFKNFNEGKYTFEVETYYKTVDNRLDYRDGANIIANNTIETEVLSGESRSYGLEFFLRKNTGNFTGMLAYTLSKSQQRTFGNFSGEPGINNGDWYNTGTDRTHDLSVTGNYKTSDRWSFGANFIFQTGRPSNFPNGQYIYEDIQIASFVDRNASRLPSFHHLDLSATYTPSSSKNKRWKSEWVFGIYNVYSRLNAASISFDQYSTGGDLRINTAYKLSVFGIIPSITYNFKF